jgi:hypothetical protein
VSELRARRLEWAALTITQGELLDAFAAHCEGIDDLRLVERTPTLVRLDWRGRERAVVELADTLPGREEPTLALMELADELVPRFLDDSLLRARLALYDLNRLQKISAVRSSVFVYFEWFLRDVYGVKVVPAETFTRGLVDRGIISLGFG